MKGYHNNTGVFFRYVVQVTAANHISSVKSQAMEVILQTVISDLAIIHDGSAIVDQETEYNVRFMGSGVQFEWDFSDGHSVKNVSYTSVKHTFKK